MTAQNNPIVIVTGSSGMIGNAVIDALIPDYRLIGFDLKGNPHAPKELESICVDLTDDRSVEGGIERVRFAHGDQIASVVHLAAYYNFSGEPSELYDEVTVRGTERLLNALSALTVEQFIFSSTMLVHRATEPGKPINEDDPLEGKWDYPESKIKTESVIRNHHASIPAVLLRIAGVYTDRGDSIPITQQIQRIVEKELTARVFPGDVSHGQSFIHLDDLVEAIRHTIEKRASFTGVEPILLGEPETYSYDQLQRTIAKLVHDDDDWDTQQIPKAVARTGAWIEDKIPGMEDPFIKPWMIDMADDHYEVDITQAKDRLGWTPKRRLIDTLPKIIDALRDDPKGWYEQHDLDPPDDLESIVQKKSRAAARA